MAYEVLVDNIDKKDWQRYASDFADYSIYQTWPYQQVRAEMDGQEVSRVVIKDENGIVVTMCQVRIKHVKPLGLRIGYVQWGPLVRGFDDTLRCSVEASVALREAYLGTRVNVFRIVPNVCNNETGKEFARLLETSGFHYTPSFEPYHTMLLSLNRPEELLRKRLHQSWRRKLKKAEAVGIETKNCTDEESFITLEKLYLEMLRRKGIKELDPEVFMTTQRLLSAAEKMNVIVAYYHGQPVTAHVTSNLGDTAILLLVASSEKGLACGSSYLVWWKAVTASNRLGMKYYDVGGIDFENNVTVSRFKAGMGGYECSHIGAFEAYSSLRVKSIWRVADKVYRLIKR